MAMLIWPCFALAQLGCHRGKLIKIKDAGFFKSAAVAAGSIHLALEVLPILRY